MEGDRRSALTGSDHRMGTLTQRRVQNRPSTGTAAYCHVRPRRFMSWPTSIWLSNGAPYPCTFCAASVQLDLQGTIIDPTRFSLYFVFVRTQFKSLFYFGKVLGHLGNFAFKSARMAFYHKKIVRLDSKLQNNIFSERADNIIFTCCRCKDGCPEFVAPSSRNF